MIANTPLTVICMESGRLSLVTARAVNGSVRVSRAVVESDRAPVGATSRTLAERLRDLGVGRGRVVLAIPRSAAVFKVFPVPEGINDAGERLSMVSLQLSRLLPMAPDEAAIDSVVVGDAGERHAIAAGTSTEPIEAARAAVQACGGKFTGAELRCAGIAALAPTDTNGPVLIIAPGAVTAEIVIADAGLPVFARSVDAQAGAGSQEQSETDRTAARLAVEAKRTLMGARAAGLTRESTTVVVLGDPDPAGPIADACELELGLPIFPSPTAIEWPEGTPPEARTRLAPLAGVVARRSAALDAIDFVHPHLAPDTGARRRQLVLLGVFALVTLIGGAMLARGKHLGGLEARRDRLEQARDDATAEVATYKARDARITHAELWAAADQDWVAHTAFVSTSVAATPGTSLGELRANSDTGFEFESGPAVYPGTWTEQTETTIRVEGVAADAPSTRALRRRFLDDQRFHVLTQGPDSGARFTFDLVAVRRDVVEEPE
ncbi:MAG: hypothetical protein DHS20C14_12790 [Phycisphaeraceae bacterium]|nr:MAG: hypothetical protein DHS20C14_12790 [Phycisphaeraceae bacterium]